MLYVEYCSKIMAQLNTYFIIITLTQNSLFMALQQGGLKGVIWVDAIQMLIIIAGVLAIIIKGTLDVGGIGKVMQIARDGNRLEFDVYVFLCYLKISKQKFKMLKFVKILMLSFTYQMLT